MRVPIAEYLRAIVPGGGMLLPSIAIGVMYLGGSAPPAVAIENEAMSHIIPDSSDHSTTDPGCGFDTDSTGSAFEVIGVWGSDTVSQTEMSIAIDPNDPANILVGANTNRYTVAGKTNGSYYRVPHSSTVGR